jgi:hypothetical protein
MTHKELPVGGFTTDPRRSPRSKSVSEFESRSRCSTSPATFWASGPTQRSVWPRVASTASNGALVKLLYLNEAPHDRDPARRATGFRYITLRARGLEALYHAAVESGAGVVMEKTGYQTSDDGTRPSR